MYRLAAKRQPSNFANDADVNIGGHQMSQTLLRTLEKQKGTKSKKLRASSRRSRLEENYSVGGCGGVPAVNWPT